MTRSRSWRREVLRATRVGRLRAAPPALRFTVRAAAASVALMERVAREMAGMPEADWARRVAGRCMRLLEEIQDDAELASILEGDDELEELDEDDEAEGW